MVAPNPGENGLGEYPMRELREVECVAGGGLRAKIPTSGILRAGAE
jgi:hypothetical protein